MKSVKSGNRLVEENRLIRNTLKRLIKLNEAVLNDLKAKRIRQANFKIVASQAMRKYENKQKWSSLELSFKNELDKQGIKENEHYLHNFRIENDLRNGFFSSDFLFFSGIPNTSLYEEITASDFPDDIALLTRKPIALEISPSIWHKKLTRAPKECPKCTSQRIIRLKQWDSSESLFLCKNCLHEFEFLKGSTEFKDKRKVEWLERLGFAVYQVENCSKKHFEQIALILKTRFEVV